PIVRNTFDYRTRPCYTAVSTTGGKHEARRDLHQSEYVKAGDQQPASRARSSREKVRLGSRQGVRGCWDQWREGQRKEAWPGRHDEGGQRQRVRHGGVVVRRSAWSLID